MLLSTAGQRGVLTANKPRPARGIRGLCLSSGRRVLGEAMLSRPCPGCRLLPTTPVWPDDGASRVTGSAGEALPGDAQQRSEVVFPIKGQPGSSVMALLPTQVLPAWGARAFANVTRDWPIAAAENFLPQRPQSLATYMGFAA
jgi:hypothetical protein